jgi:hypothetical protein
LNKHNENKKIKKKKPQTSEEFEVLTKFCELEFRIRIHMHMHDQIKDINNHNDISMYICNCK